ncbi:hypothetical protein HanHA300_Chr17g0668381 [Helianthus annuus]|nr:hypothetical protein HanHA300_Chr17g0668381 [Helianthus annuus]KAJ0435216.1 hypothetical protein HanIR_Chr17g0890911 [Helianthus annuus]
MALREDKCFLVRRVADRGVEKNIGDSRVRGDRLNCDRRSADRGNEIRNRDPCDINKIKRLRQRVQDLEEIKRLRQRVRDLKEIRRLHQRVRDLELQPEMRKTETESSTVVWDEGGDGEEHPFGRHPPWFYEPIYQESLWEDKPRFDQDGIEPDEEEYSFLLEVLSGITVLKEKPIKETKGNGNEYAEVSSVATSDQEASGVGLKTPLMPPIIVKGLNITDYLMISPSIVDVQVEGNKILNAKLHIADNMCDVGNSDFVKVDDRVIKKWSKYTCTTYWNMWLRYKCE